MPDRFNTRGALVLSLAEFNALRVAQGTYSLATHKSARTLVNGRWHRISRQYSFGATFFPLDPITIRLTASELRECASHADVLPDGS